MQRARLSSSRRLSPSSRRVELRPSSDTSIRLRRTVEQQKRSRPSVHPQSSEVIGTRARSGFDQYDGEAIRLRSDDIEGDSGGSVWQLTTGNTVGLMSSGPEGPEGQHKSAITPFLPLIDVPEGKAPGILDAPGMSPLSLVTD